MITFVRSTVFNILFYGATACACILCLPGLLLPKEKAMFLVKSFVNTIHFLEKYVLGLDYEVRGIEHLPEDGAFIVAAKHQSPYETFKLNILFNDPAIVLKQELLNIPLWGKFLAKIDPIAIDRSKGSSAMKQIVDGGLHVKEQGRPIVIFPQGTRVYPWQTTEEKPYKQGIARLYEKTELPVVPLALNTGHFWPRKSWNKKAGTVIFEFLPAFPPHIPPREFLDQLEQTLEHHSTTLYHEALSHEKK